MIEKTEYCTRRKRLLSLLSGETGVAIFIGNSSSAAQSIENGYKFRQDSNWLYFWGIDEPGFAAAIDLESGEETIYADDADIDDIIWTGPVPSVAERAAAVGVENTASAAALDSFVSEQRSRGRKIHFLPTSRWYNAHRIARLVGIRPEECFRNGKAGCRAASEALVRAVISLRLVKDEREIALLDEASDLGYAMHTAGRRGIRPGRIEQEIVGEMEGIALANGWGVSFGTILTQHGEIFHCGSHDSIIEPGRLMVIDAGVESNAHYASDHTRTYPTSGKFTQMQRDIYNIVYDCNELAFSLTKPGTAYREVHLAVAHRMLDSLKSLGLVSGDTGSMVADGIAGLFMPHGLGHNMGLDDHDMEDLGENLVGYDDDQKRSRQLGLGSLRMARRLAVGNVISDEPGIYFIPQLIEIWKRDGIGKGCINFAKLKKYYNFGGIRLEDDVLVTADGARRLGSKRLPIAPDEIEAVMEKENRNGNA